MNQQVARFQSGVIDELLGTGALQKVHPNRTQADAFLTEARTHLMSARVVHETGTDAIGAFGLTYEAARKAMAAVLINQGLRATGGEGGHRSLGRALGDQLRAAHFPTADFDWMRRKRNSGAYGSESEAPPAAADVADGVQVAEQIIGIAGQVLDVMMPY
jgi:HEPN domain-containing protein